MIAAVITTALSTALVLAAEGLKCFPCSPNKRPATPHGFLEASDDPATLRELWSEHPGELVGIATGSASGIDALDLDAKHASARVWWIENRRQVPETRTHRTRSRGLHLLFQHAPGLRCWTGRPVVGIDGRSDGGYVIWWPATGLPVLSDAPPTPWPKWLLDELSSPSAPAPPAVWNPLGCPTRYRVASRYASAALQHAADRVTLAPTGSRNATLNAQAYGIGRLVAAGLLDGQEVADTLAMAAVAAGLAPQEIARTLGSALRARGVL